MTEMTTRQGRCLEQLNAWVAGDSKHNTVDDECCPDFSCCRPELLAPKARREEFQTRFQLDEVEMYKALPRFLRSFARGDQLENVHILVPVDE